MAVKGKAGPRPFKERVQKELDKPQNADLKPKQARLPEMDDPIIEEIEAAAEQYADARDKRLAVFRRELTLKDELLNVLKKHKKKAYHREPYDIEIVAEGEKLQVKITKDKK